jgi:ATP-dependent helicase HrpB
MIKEWGEYVIDSHLESIADAITDPARNTCLVKAGAGSGKTTRVPPFLLNHFPDGKILILEPRRLAAKLTAARVAYFLGEELGEQVGHMIRQDVKVGPNTKILFITEGLFARLLRDDPALSDVSLVILDEFHERNLHSDMALAIIRRIQQERRADLKLLVMSATLELAALDNYLGDAKKFDITGELHPVEIEYRPNTPVSGGRKSYYKRWEEHAAEVVEELLHDSRSPLNLLIFLSGIGEIRKLEQILKERGVNRLAKILPLAGTLSASAQGEVFLLDGQRKVVLATNVAETSLTLPDISGVVDLGQAKIAAFAPWSGMPSLELQRISKASAIQRAGRAGRTGPGVVYRLYTQTEFAARPDFTAPDIERVELSNFVLDTLSLGFSMESMPWLTPPNPRNLEASIKLLQMLECIDGDEALTPKGHWVLKIPLHPRLGVLIYHSWQAGFALQGVLAAAILSEGAVLKGEPPEDEDLTSDLLLNMKLYLKELEHYHQSQINRPVEQRVRQLVSSICQQLKIEKRMPSSGLDYSTLTSSLLAAFPDRVAVRREVKKRKIFGASYSFVMGKGGGLGRFSLLSHRSPKYFIALDAVENPKLKGDRSIQVESAHAITLEQLKVDPANLITTTHEIALDQRKTRPKISRHTSYGNIVVESRGVGESEDEESISLNELVKRIWPAPFSSDHDLKIYHRKIDLLNEADVEHNFPRFSDQLLDFFIDSICEGLSDLIQLQEHPLDQYIMEQLSEAERSYFTSLFPSTAKLENGRVVKINYSENKLPSISLAVQELYGHSTELSVGDGKISIQLQLTAPNGRIATIINDPKQFWHSSYSQLARELSGRYPKHYWPDNPAQAKPYRLKKELNR